MDDPEEEGDKIESEDKVTISRVVKRVLNHIERRAYSKAAKKKIPPQPSTEYVNEIIQPIETTGLKANVTNVIVRSNLTRLTNVEYPGVVENPSMALRTLGGTIRVSEVFHHPPKRLELRYRPGEIFCNPVFATGRTTCGLLIKVRQRKKKNNPESKETPVNDLAKQVILIDLDEGEDSGGEDKGQVEHIFSLPVDPENSTTTQPDKTEFIKTLIEQEEKIMDQVEAKYEKSDHSALVGQILKQKDIGRVKSSISVPKGDYRPPVTDIQLEPLGVISKVYEFNGVSDFQYLPMIRNEDGEHISITDDIFPSFGDPDNGVLYDAVNMENGTKPSQPFYLPMHMSKFDKPLHNLFKIPLINTEQDPSQLTLEDDTEVNSTRSRRSVYTHIVHFHWNGMETIIPNAPFPQAIDDCTNKMLTGKKMDTVRELFAERPVWTKLALEYATKFSTEHLKYILPTVAYYSTNGPWRSFWIRLGYDPRKHKTAFVYQLVDFRFPMEYRSHQDVDQSDNECYHKFRPDRIPPKAQMFYQFCDLMVPEIQELEGALTVRFNNSEDIECDPRFGYLDVDVLEFCRYCMTRCIEVRLHSLGKIKSVVLEPIRLGPGGIIPVAQLKVKPRKQPKKRIRTTTSTKAKNIKVAKAEPFAITFEESIDVHAAPKIHNLTDYFDDDEEEEEDEEEDNEDDVEEHQDPLGNLQDCFDDDEIEEIEASTSPTTDSGGHFKAISDKS